MKNEKNEKNNYCPCNVKRFLLYVYISDTYELPELLTFFEQNYSHIYFIYFDCLCNAELELRQRGMLVCSSCILKVMLFNKIVAFPWLLRT